MALTDPWFSIAPHPPLPRIVGKLVVGKEARDEAMAGQNLHLHGIARTTLNQPHRNTTAMNGKTRLVGTLTADPQRQTPHSRAQRPATPGVTIGAQSRTTVGTRRRGTRTTQTLSHRFRHNLRHMALSPGGVQIVMHSVREGIAIAVVNNLYDVGALRHGRSLTPSLFLVVCRLQVGGLHLVVFSHTLHLGTLAP